MRNIILRIKKIPGAEKYVILVQIASLLPVLYFLVAVGSNAIYTEKNLFSVLFELGLAFLSRVEVLCISLLYRAAGNELYIFFAILILALVFGLVIKRLLHGTDKTRRITEIVLTVWIICDIVLRLLPIRVNTVQDPLFRILGIVFRLLCLVLVGRGLLKKRK